MGADSDGIEVVWDSTPQVGEEVQRDRVARAAMAALEHGDLAGSELAVVFVDESTLTSMHAEHLDDDTPTDVITFDLGVGDGEENPGPIGELYVSVDRAREVSQRRGVSFERELLLYVVHGTLHLCGFDDHEPEDRAEMRV
ncbi:MAG: putative rRNA maturation factor, partial [Gammaproteobacteria bacterium]